MAGKACVFAGRSMAVAIDNLTKNQMADLILHLAQQDIGPAAGDETIVCWIAERMKTVWAARKDRPVDIVDSWRRMVAYEAKKAAEQVR